MKRIVIITMFVAVLVVIMGNASAEFDCDYWSYSEELPEGIDIDFDLECGAANGVEGLNVTANSTGIYNPGIKTIQIWSNTSNATDVIDYEDPYITWSKENSLTGPFQTELGDGVQFEIDGASDRSNGVTILFDDNKCPEEIRIAIHIRWENENGVIEDFVTYVQSNEVTSENGEMIGSVWAFSECSNENGTGDPQEEIPEFPTVALPIAAILGLAFLFQRRKE